MKRTFNKSNTMLQPKFSAGQKVKVTAGARNGLIGIVLERVYVPVLKTSRWRVEFDNNWGRGLIGEDDLIAI